MNIKELIEKSFVGEDNIIGFASIVDIDAYDLINNIVRVRVRGYPTEYTVIDSVYISICTSGIDDIMYAYDKNIIEKAVSILNAMGISKDDIIFHFPNKDAPLIITIDYDTYSHLGTKWGIIMCSCDIDETSSSDVGHGLIT